MAKYNFTKRVKAADGTLHEYHPKTNVEQVEGLEAYIKAIVTEAVNSAKSDMQVPIGGYYIAADGTNPSKSLGYGVWTAETDRVLIGAGGKYQVGSTGGSESVRLQVGEIPSHSHGLSMRPNWWELQGGIDSYGWTDDGLFNNRIVVQGDAGNLGTNSAGSGNAHNNMMPYKAVYIWRRVV